MHQSNLLGDKSDITLLSEWYSLLLFILHNGSSGKWSHDQNPLFIISTKQVLIGQLSEMYSQLYLYMWMSIISNIIYLAVEFILHLKCSGAGNVTATDLYNHQV